MKKDSLILACSLNHEDQEYHNVIDCLGVCVLISNQIENLSGIM
jgi:hypothetical protein